MNPHLLFPILFIVALIFWAALYWLINKLYDKFERKHADHHRR